MTKMIRVRTPEFIRELNIAGSIVRGRMDERGPFIDITPEQEREFRRQLKAIRDAESGDSLEEIHVPTGTELTEVDEKELQDQAAAAAPDTRTQTMNVADSAVLIAAVTDPAELGRLRAGEEAHPDYPGGRKGVMTYFDQRLIELKAIA